MRYAFKSVKREQNLMKYGKRRKRLEKKEKCKFMKWEKKI